MAGAQNYDNWERKTVRITDLFLDPDNIRLQVQVKSQEALINDLFLNEDAMQVLESITSNGFFPDERPVAISEKNKLYIIEGNRRLSALKVLLRPEIVPTKEAKIRSLAKNIGKPITEIEIVIAPDRDSVSHFLASKHTQNIRRPWRPLRQAYFYKAELSRGKTIQDLRNEYPNVDIGKFLRLINIHTIAKSIKYDTDEIARKVHNEGSFPATTIERLYEDKQVRAFLGFDFGKDGDVKVQIKKEEFEKGLKKIVQDAVDKVIDSRSLNKEADRKKYLESFPKTEIPSKIKASKPTSVNDFKEQKLPSVNAKRRKLAPVDIEFTLNCPGVRRVLNELQEIDYNKFPNATHDLLRSFLECGLKAYFDHCGKVITPRRGQFVYLDTVLEEFINEMDQTKNVKLKQVASKIRDNAKMTSYSATFLNATNHNPDIFATPQEVVDAWETMEPLFRFILAPKQQSNGKNQP